MTGVGREPKNRSMAIHVQGLRAHALSLLVLAGAFWLARHWSLARGLTIVGNVTIDVVDGKKALGGAVSYAAAVASAWGVRACIVSAHAPDADLGPVFQGHDLVVVASTHTLVFEHSYTFWGNHRKLRVTAQPNVTLGWQHLPARCRRARTVLLGPLMPQDLNPSAFVQQDRPWWHRALGLPEQEVGLMGQGLQRVLDSSGKVKPLADPSQQLVDALGGTTSVFLSDVETDAWPNGTVAGLATRTRRFLVTRGKDDADEYIGATAQRHPVVQVTEVVDTNGAGDTFATAYMLAAAAGHSSPVRVAHWAGAVAVGQPQACKPACITQALQAGWHTMPASQAGLAWLPLQRLLLLPPVKQVAQLLGLAGPGSSGAAPAA